MDIETHLEAYINVMVTIEREKGKFAEVSCSVVKDTYNNLLDKVNELKKEVDQD